MKPPQKKKLEAHKINVHPDNLITISKHSKAEITPNFTAEFIEVNHSIKDSFTV